MRMTTTRQIEFGCQRRPRGGKPATVNVVAITGRTLPSAASGWVPTQAAVGTGECEQVLAVGIDLAVRC